MEQDITIEDVFSLRRPKDIKAGIASGLKSVAKGVVGGTVGLLAAPAVGAVQEGLPGFAKGVAAGNNIIGRQCLFLRPEPSICLYSIQRAHKLGNAATASKSACWTAATSCCRCCRCRVAACGWCISGSNPGCSRHSQSARGYNRKHKRQSLGSGTTTLHHHIKHSASQQP